GRVGGLHRGRRPRRFQLGREQLRRAGALLGGSPHELARGGAGALGQLESCQLLLDAHAVTTRSSRCTTQSRRRYPRRASISPLRSPAMRRTSSAAYTARPRANGCPSSETISTGSPWAKLPRTSRTPEGSRLFLPSSRAVRAPSSTLSSPRVLRSSIHLCLSRRR